MKTHKFLVFSSLIVVAGFLLCSLFFSDLALAKSEPDNQHGQNSNGLTVTGNDDKDGVENGNATSSDEDEDKNKNEDEDEKDNNATSTPEKENWGQENAAIHRSVVATFVHKLLEVANREGGIGEQVRVIARAQNDAATTTAEVLNRVEKRNKIKTFLIGSDYKNLGSLRSEMVQTRNRIEQLKDLMEKAETAADKTELQNQIQTLLREQTRIDNFIKAQEGKFSLFGWLVKLFKK